MLKLNIIAVIQSYLEVVKQLTFLRTRFNKQIFIIYQKRKIKTGSVKYFTYSHGLAKSNKNQIKLLYLIE